VEVLLVDALDDSESLEDSDEDLLRDGLFFDLNSIILSSSPCGGGGGGKTVVAGGAGDTCCCCCCC